MDNYLEIIEKIKNSKHVTNIHIFEEREVMYWNYYIDISGFYKENYFCIRFCNHKVNNQDVIEISHYTEEIKIFKNDFEILEENISTQKIKRRLQTFTFKEVAKEIGISRTTLYKRIQCNDWKKSEIVLIKSL
jgi:DNA-binding NtrC family response regulator